MIRLLKKSEFNRLLEIENRCFSCDKLTLYSCINYRKRIYVLIINEIIVGYYMWSYENKTIYLGSLAVDPDYKGNGYSRYLMIHFLDKCKLKPHSLHVCTSNKIAINLYERYNFIRQHEEMNFYEDNTNAFYYIR